VLDYEQVFNSLGGVMLDHREKFKVDMHVIYQSSIRRGIITEITDTSVAVRLYRKDNVRPGNKVKRFTAAEAIHKLWPAPVPAWRSNGVEDEEQE
jgi:hypothetical protein